MLTRHLVQEEVTEYVSGHLSPEQRDAVELHLKECQTCAAEIQALSQVWEILDTWPTADPPEKAVSAVRQAVTTSLLRKKTMRGAQWVLSGRRLVWAVTKGLLFALGSVGVLAGAANLGGFSAPMLLCCGSVWSAVYILAFALYYFSEQLNGSSVNLRVVTLAGLLTTALSLVATHAFSVHTLVRHCELSPWGAAAMSHLGYGGTYLLLGALYVLVPLFVVSFTVGKQVKQRPVIHGLLCAGLFFLLTLPAIYLQCGVLPLGVALSWMAGAFLGSVTGAPLGFSLRTRFALLASDQQM